MVGTTNELSADEGRKIVAEAKTWKGVAYGTVGKASSKGPGGSADCSGSTWGIYRAAGFPYEYQATATFPAYVKESGRFRELGSNEKQQDGDILYWSGHMAIYSTFTTVDVGDAITDRVNKKGARWSQKNDMWTASHPGGSPYGPAEIRTWKNGVLPQTFRYVK